MPISARNFYLLNAFLYLFLNVNSQTYAYDYGYATNVKQYTRKIQLKQGAMQGIVVEPRINRALPPIEQYLGIPYAAPPIRNLRFMPPGSAPSWFGIKIADSFGPVCPQNFPDKSKMAPEREEYFDRLAKHLLLNQSEDCLYLNIYAPVQGKCVLIFSLNLMSAFLCKENWGDFFFLEKISKTKRALCGDKWEIFIYRSFLVFFDCSRFPADFFEITLWSHSGFFFTYWRS